VHVVLVVDSPVRYESTNDPYPLFICLQRYIATPLDTAAMLNERNKCASRRAAVPVGSRCVTVRHVLPRNGIPMYYVLLAVLQYSTIICLWHTFKLERNIYPLGTKRERNRERERERETGGGGGAAVRATTVTIITGRVRKVYCSEVSPGSGRSSFW
jgi:hypothetical protein